MIVDVQCMLEIFRRSLVMAAAIHFHRLAHIPALFLLVLFTRGGRKSGESPGFDFKIRKEFRPVSVEESDRRARGGREEGGEGFLEGRRGQERRGLSEKRAAGSGAKKN